MKIYENQTARKWRLRQSKNCSSSNGHMTKHLTVIQNARYVCRNSQLLFAVYVSETI